jgi:hypothetical protein
VMVIAAPPKNQLYPVWGDLVHISQNCSKNAEAPRSFQVLCIAAEE